LDTTTIRFGGAFGVVCALAMIPVYVTSARDASAALAAANGIVPLLHILFGLAFLGVLVAMLRQAAGPAPDVYAALAGGVLFFTLTAGGFALAAIPAAVSQSGAPDITELNEPLLTLATQLYSYCQIGAVAMIFATSAIVWRTSVLPKWAAVGAVLGFLPLVHAWLPLPAAASSLAWILLIGLVMLIAPTGARETSQPVNDHAPGVRN
jgi:hypothetical protein